MKPAVFFGSMKILPPTTLPPKQPFTRQHQPPLIDRDKGYRTFLLCLRWEFGFTCAFCLLHEGDLTEKGVKHTQAQFSVEHRELQKDDPHRPDKQANLYSNCIYACMYCNQARSDKPLNGPDNVQALDPTLDAWDEHFEVDADQGVLIAKTPNATHTLETYNLNDERKKDRRLQRRKVIKEALELLLNGPAENEDFRSLARQLSQSDDPKQRAQAEILLKAACRQSKQMEEARKTLERYKCIPTPEEKLLKCRCNRAKLCIPWEFERQALDV